MRLKKRIRRSVVDDDMIILAWHSAARPVAADLPVVIDDAGPDVCVAAGVDQAGDAD